jgi:hypothetical protein
MDWSGNVGGSGSGLQQIIETGAYSIEDDFFANFKVHNESSVENIF